MTATPPNKHYLVLDAFRGLCACLVALSHFNGNSIFHGSYIFDRGAIYVDFFFVLSGFVIFANYSQKLREGYSFGHYIFLRFARLYPLHLSILLSFIGIDVLQYFISIEGAALYKPFSAPGETPWAIFANLSLIHALGTTDTIVFNGPSWSISTEFYTYIAFALVLIAFKRKYIFAVTALTVISLIVLSINRSDLFAKLDYGIFRCIYGFGCGALLWEFYARYYKTFSVVKENKWFMNAIEIACLIGALIYINYFAFDALSYLAPLVFVAVIWVFSFETGICSKLLTNKFFMLLGTLSYSIYMTHIFIAGKLFALPTRLLENKGIIDISVDGKSIGGSDMTLYGQTVLQGTLIELGFLIVVIICSALSYKLIEAPFRDAAKKYLKKKKIK